MVRWSTVEEGVMAVERVEEGIGHRSRITMLEELIQYMRSKPGVWFATHEDVARHAKKYGGSN